LYYQESTLIKQARPCLDAGAKADALAMLKKARDLLEADRDAEKSGHFAEMAGLYARAQEYDKAFEQAGAIKPMSRFKPEAYLEILKAYLDIEKRETGSKEEKRLLGRIVDHMGW
jgi:hypothetical protein